MGTLAIALLVVVGLVGLAMMAIKRTRTVGRRLAAVGLIGAPLVLLLYGVLGTALDL